MRPFCNTRTVSLLSSRTDGAKEACKITTYNEMISLGGLPREGDIPLPEFNSTPEPPPPRTTPF